MWYLLLLKIAERLRQANIAEDVMLGAVLPTQANVSENHTILLMRGDEKNSDPTIQEQVEVTFFLEAWTRDDDPTFTNGYARLTDLEKKLEAVLVAYRDEVGRLNQEACMLDERWQVMDVYVDKKVGSGDSIRPLIGTQYTLVAKLYDTSDEEGIW